jgi:hypothetical protein
MCVQEDHVSLPGLMPICNVDLRFIWKLGAIKYVASEDTAQETSRMPLGPSSKFFSSLHFLFHFFTTN